jgi:hypothetical protein
MSISDKYDFGKDPLEVSETVLEGTYTVKGYQLGLSWNAGYNAALERVMENIKDAPIIVRQDVLDMIEGMMV